MVLNQYPSHHWLIKNNILLYTSSKWTTPSKHQLQRLEIVLILSLIFPKTSQGNAWGSLSDFLLWPVVSIHNKWHPRNRNSPESMFSLLFPFLNQMVKKKSFHRWDWYVLRTLLIQWEYIICKFFNRNVCEIFMSVLFSVLLLPFLKYNLLLSEVFCLPVLTWKVPVEATLIIYTGKTPESLYTLKWLCLHFALVD